MRVTSRTAAGPNARGVRCATQRAKGDSQRTVNGTETLHSNWTKCRGLVTYQYTGRETDGTGLHYNRARYYSPAVGRFISEDPLRLGSGDVNFYGYATSNPLGFRDPLGTSIFGDVFGPGGLVDDAVPNQVGDAAAGLFDGATAGYASKAFGAKCWNSPWHDAGVVAGAWAAGYATGGGAAGVLEAAGGGRAVVVLGGGAVGGATEGYLGNGLHPTSGQVAASVGIGLVTAGVGDAFRGSDANPTPEGPIATSVAGSAAYNAAAGSTSGRKDCG